MIKFAEKFKINLDSFKRKSSQRYLPEIDALRFFAIMPVLLVHFSAALLENNSGFDRSIIDNENEFRQLLIKGNLGVHLFFAISGFILTLPFINKKWEEMNFKSYFLRRLIRIEPPYIIAITIFLVVHIILSSETIAFLLERYFASFLYIHNIIYDYRSFILPVAWSLEIEVQFYLLMPILLFVLKIYASKYWRYFIYLMLFLLSINIDLFPFHELNDFMIFFLAGIVAADLYKNIEFKKHLIWDILFSLSMVLFFVINSDIFRSLFLFIVIISSLNLVWIKKILTNNIIVIIGGMCYSLYLLHYPLYHLLMKLFSDKLTTFNSFEYDFIVQSLIFIPISIILISFYFLIVEKPFMVLSQKIGKRK